ncbi:hypothetical protein PanWU01x14_316670, partial [Parasponia andersonii]
FLIRVEISSRKVNLLSEITRFLIDSFSAHILSIWEFVRTQNISLPWVIIEAGPVIASGGSAFIERLVCAA